MNAIKEVLSPLYELDFVFCFDEANKFVYIHQCMIMFQEKSIYVPNKDVFDLVQVGSNIIGHCLEGGVKDKLPERKTLLVDGINERPLWFLSRMYEGGRSWEKNLSHRRRYAKILKIREDYVNTIEEN